MKERKCKSTGWLRCRSALLRLRELASDPAPAPGVKVAFIYFISSNCILIILFSLDL